MAQETATQEPSAPSADESSPSPESQTPPEPPIEGDPDALGDPGKKALDSMKEKWHAERDRAAKVEAAAAAQAEKAKALEAKLAALEGREAEWEAEQADREKEQKFLAKANDRILKAEVRAAAKGELQDPEDAFLHLDLSSFEVDDDGRVDTDQIAAAIADLTESKPYLAAQGEKWAGSVDQGARNGSTKPRIRTREQLAGLSPQEQINAFDEGRLDFL